MESALKRKFDALALNLEAKLQKVASFKLMRIDKDTLNSPIISQHWAEEHHPLAEASQTSPRIIAYSPIDGKPRAGFDESEGFRELETYHSRTADTDKDTLDKQFNAILDGKINLLDMDYYLKHFAQATSNLADSQLTTQNQLNYYSAQIEAHAKAIVKLNKVLDKLDRLLSQRKLNEYKG